MSAALVALTVFLTASKPCCSHTLTRQQRRVLNAWLEGYPTYRLATDGDSACPAQITEMRTQNVGVWKPVPDYHPYQVSADFNGDGITDFAAVLLDTKRVEQPFALVIFNGPLSGTNVAPAFFEAGLGVGLDCGGLFIGPPRPKPYRLLVGPFNSDSGGRLVPSGSAYAWDDSNDEDDQ